MIFTGKKYWFSEPERVELQRRSCCTRKVLLSFLYDGNDKLEKEEILKKLESRDSVEVVLGELPEEMLDSLDLVVLARVFRRICRLSLK